MMLWNSSTSRRANVIVHWLYYFLRPAVQLVTRVTAADAVSSTSVLTEEALTIRRHIVRGSIKPHLRARIHHEQRPHAIDIEAGIVAGHRCDIQRVIRSQIEDLFSIAPPSSVALRSSS